MIEQMTPDQYLALSEFLQGPDGCDFQQSNPDDASTITWHCDHTLTKTHQWLKDHELRPDAIYWHVCCDCEVLFNMPEGLLPDEEEEEHGNVTL